MERKSSSAPGRTGCTRVRRTSWTTSTRWGCGPAARRRETHRLAAEHPGDPPTAADPEHPELIRWPASAPRYEHASPAIVDQRHEQHVIFPRARTLNRARADARQATPGSTSAPSSER